MPEYEQALGAVEERKGREKVIGLFSGVNPRWWIIGGFIALLFYYWYNLQSKTAGKSWVPFAVIVGALIAIALGQGSKETNWVTREEAEAEVYKKIRVEQPDSLCAV